MAQTSQIEWTDQTWNPTTGCDKVSAGCKFCYAELMAERLVRMGSARYDNGFKLTLHEDKIEEPLTWRKPRKVFVNSMSDLFHEQVDLEFLRRVFDVMQRTPRHTYQILTKRPERMAGLLSELERQGDYVPAPHIWLGTSVEDELVLSRVSWLKQVPAQVRFLSCEPLLGPLGPDLDLTDIHWVIAGGESGLHLFQESSRQRRALVDYAKGVWTPRPERIAWVRQLRDVCARQEVAYFFKQWGGSTPKAAGRLLDGAHWDQYPKPSQTS